MRHYAFRGLVVDEGIIRRSQKGGGCPYLGPCLLQNLRRASPLALNTRTMNRAALDPETHDNSMHNAFWSSQHDYSRSREYFEPFGGLMAFFDVGGFFFKKSHFCYFSAKQASAGY